MSRSGPRASLDSNGLIAIAPGTADGSAASGVEEIGGRLAGLGRTAVGLRIFGDDLDPEEVTALLGAQPTFCARRGDVRRTLPAGEVVARSGSWQLSIDDCVPGDLNAQIRALLAKLTDDLSVWHALSDRYRCDLFCGIFMREGNEGTELDPAVMTMLGNRGLYLGLDIYEPSL